MMDYYSIDQFSNVKRDQPQMIITNAKRKKNKRVHGNIVGPNI